MKTNNLFKNNPKKVKKTMLAVKVLIGSISAATIFQSAILAAGFLISGAVIDFIVDLTFNDDENKTA